jgi:hypothetical protein
MNIREEELYKQKYLKYKQKYLEAKQLGGHIKLVKNESIEVPDETVDKKHLICMIKRDLGSGVYDVVDMHHIEHRVRIRAGVWLHLPSRFKGNKKRESLIEKYVLVETQPGGVGYKENYGDIIKIYMDNEADWLEEHGYIKDMSSKSQYTSNVEFVAPVTPMFHETGRKSRELPPSDDDDDEYNVTVPHADEPTSSEDDFFLPAGEKTKSKSKSKPKEHLDIDFHAKIEGSRNPYLPPEQPKWGKAPSADSRWGRPHAAPSAESRWGPSRAAPSAASRWQQHHGAETTRPWDQLRAQKGEPEVPSD